MPAKTFSGAKEVLKWSDNLYCHQRKPKKHCWTKHASASNRAFSGSWDTKTDGWVMIANALEWAAQGGSPQWITSSPLSGIVKGGSSNEQKLSFDATSLEEATIRLRCNYHE